MYNDEQFQKCDTANQEMIYMSFSVHWVFKCKKPAGYAFWNKGG